MARTSGGLDYAGYGARGTWWLIRKTLRYALVILAFLAGMVVTVGYDRAEDTARSMARGVAQIVPAYADRAARIDPDLTIATLTADLADERAALAARAGELAALRDEAGGLRAERDALAQEIAALTEAVEADRAFRAGVEAVAAEIAARTEAGADRALAVLPGIELPILGPSVAARAAARQVADACATLSDLEALIGAGDRAAVVCALPDPDPVAALAEARENEDAVTARMAALFPELPRPVAPIDPAPEAEEDPQ